MVNLRICFVNIGKETKSIMYFTDVEHKTTLITLSKTCKLQQPRTATNPTLYVSFNYIRKNKRKSAIELSK